MAERDKTEIEIAIEYVQRRLSVAKYHGLIDELTAALAWLLKAKNSDKDGHL